MNIEQIPKGQRETLADELWRKVKKARRSPEFQKEFEIWERERQAARAIQEEKSV